MTEEHPAETQAEQDPQGRPLRLENRLEAIVSMLVPEGIDPARTTLHAMAWWEESISPTLGCEVAPADWVRTDGGPRSAAVDAVLDGWEREGVWTKWENHPIRSEEMNARKELVARGEHWSGVETITIRTAPADFLPWYQTMCGFLQGMQVSGKVNPSMFDGARDIRMMSLADPTFASSDAWESCGGPGRVFEKAEDDSRVAGYVGNGAGYAMALYRVLEVTDLRYARPAARDDFEAAWLLARYIIDKAARAFPEFGDRLFMRNRDALQVDERTMGDGTVEATFLLDGETVASAAWRPGKRMTTGTYPTGKEWAYEIDDGELLGIEVAEGYRRRGIGTYVMRHALTRGCARAVAPPSDGYALWGRHGYPDDAGSWKLERSGWPTCRSIDAPAPEVAAGV
jgi:ribosomal protein S18 acetylase RimI-like enzyme